MSDNNYYPSTEVLYKYAQVLVQFALNNGKGLNPEEVVFVRVPDIAKPLAKQLQKVILEQGGHPLIRLKPTGGFERDFFELANKKQLEFFPDKYIQARVDLIDHQIGIIADPDPMELSSIDPQKIMQVAEVNKQYRQWILAKEMKNKFSWTAALWATQAKAQAVGLSMNEYWDQIIKACYLDHEDPVAKWQEINEQQQWLKKYLTQMEIQSLHIQGEDVDLHIKIGSDRRWQSGSGSNIPSFEVFTSPDWRGINGWIRFNQPLYRYGNIVRDIYLEFIDGVVTNYSATEGEEVLEKMLETPGGNKIGEFSLTDERMSRITHTMAETLYDENITNNTHLALGMSYRDCYRYDGQTLSDDDWEAKGFNDSSLHSDIVSTSERQVTATLGNGKKQVIYQNGRFSFWQD